VASSTVLAHGYETVYVQTILVGDDVPSISWSERSTTYPDFAGPIDHPWLALFSEAHDFRRRGHA
jgi:hypothetical protein